MVQAPENILNGIAAPTEIGGVPAYEILPPVRQEIFILSIAGAPAPCDRIALEINADAALPRLFQQLRMRDPGIPVGPGNGLVGRGCRRDWRTLDELAGPFDEGRPVFSNAVASVMLTPGEFPADQGQHRRHRIRQVIARSSQVSFSQDSVCGTCRHGGHEASVRIDPLGVPLFDHAIADEAGSRRHIAISS